MLVPTYISIIFVVHNIQITYNVIILYFYTLFFVQHMYICLTHLIHIIENVSNVIFEDIFNICFTIFRSNI